MDRVKNIGIKKWKCRAVRKYNIYNQVKLGLVVFVSVIIFTGLALNHILSKLDIISKEDNS